MSEVKHTPGPWSVEDPLGADVGLAIVQSGLKSYEWTFIAMVTCSEPGDSEEVGRVILSKEQKANACLIAAAPDAYEFASWVVDATPEELVRLARIKARAFLAKAEGR